MASSQALGSSGSGTAAASSVAWRLPRTPYHTHTLRPPCSAAPFSSPHSPARSSLAQPASLTSGKTPASSAGVLERNGPAGAGPSPTNGAAATAHSATALASPASSSPPSSTSSPMPTPDRSGYLALMFVPILWGTYNPSIRYLYAESDPLDAASLTAVRTALSAAALLTPALVGYLWKQGRAAWARRTQEQQQQQQSLQRLASSDEEPPAAHHASMSTALAAAADGAADGVSAASGATPADDAAAAAAASTSSSSASVAVAAAASTSTFSAPLNTARLGPWMTSTFNSVVLGGIELGILNFLGTALQVEGLHSTSATRAGFLAEVTAVLTPFVSYLAGYDIPRQMWVAVGVGLVGSTMVAYDTSQVHTDPTPEAAATASTASSAAPVMTTAADATATAAAAASAAAATATASAPLAIAAASGSATSAGTAMPAAAAVASTAGSALPLATTPGFDAAAAALPAGAGATAQAAAAAADSIAATADVAASLASSASVAVGAALDAASAAAADAAISATAVATAAAATVAASGGALDAAAADASAAAAGAAVVAVAAVASTAAAAVAAGTPSSTALEITGGEGYLLLACLFYSICTVRMGIYSPRHNTMELAAMKKVGLSSMSLMWMASTNLQNGAALGSVFAFPDLASRTPMSIAVLLYSGLGPGALATFLQVSGLSTVPAINAQVIYSMTPLTTAFFAFLILGGEPTGPVAWAGGGLIIVAALMAADAQNKQHARLVQEHAEKEAAAL